MSSISSEEDLELLATRLEQHLTQAENHLGRSVIPKLTEKQEFVDTTIMQLNAYLSYTKEISDLIKKGLQV